MDFNKFYDTIEEHEIGGNKNITNEEKLLGEQLYWCQSAIFFVVFIDLLYTWELNLIHEKYYFL